MSILAKLLKKGDDRQEAGEILPGLQQAVTSAGSSPDKRRQRYLLIAAIAAAAIAGGGLLTVYLQTQAPQPTIVGRQPAVQAVITPQPQSQPSSSKVAALPPPPVEVEQEKSSRKKVHHTAKKTPAKFAAATQKKSATTIRETGPKQGSPIVKDRATLDAWLFAAKTAETRRDYQQAMSKYRKVLEADPQNYRIMNNLASICLNLELYDEALLYANQALKLKADYVSALVNGGIAQSRLGNLSGARTLLGRAVTVEPANRQALYNLGLSQERSNVLDDALTTWRRLADAGDTNGVLGMARIKERRGENQDALRLYREVTANPEAGQRVKDAARERIAVLDR